MSEDTIETVSEEQAAKDTMLAVADAFEVIATNTAMMSPDKTKITRAVELIRAHLSDPADVVESGASN